MKTDSPLVTYAKEMAASGAADRWTPLVDEPPPLDWDLEDLLPPAADEIAELTLHSGRRPSCL